MSYAVYTTRGFILASAPSGEASKTYSIYTQEFGLITARAQGVRLLASKLRYNLEEYSLATLSLVRGKEVWRITGAEKEPLPRSGAQIRARILHLTRRLVQGEERNDVLFSALLSLKDEKASETAVLAEILSALGYLNKEALKDKGEREKIMEINRALKETQL
jgi:recombinational DNA repair protein (RecF pathway)